ncbi:MAG: hypothetical protein ACE5K4_01075 [Candidatus Hydrothermarchaeota archaeon]
MSKELQLLIKIIVSGILLVFVIFNSFVIALNTERPFYIQENDLLSPIINRGDILLVESPINIKKGDFVVVDMNFPVIMEVLDIKGKVYLVGYPISGKSRLKGPFLIQNTKISGKLYTIENHIVKLPKVGRLKIFLSNLPV